MRSMSAVFRWTCPTLTPGSIGRSLRSRGVTPCVVFVSPVISSLNSLGYRLIRSCHADEYRGSGDADDNRADQTRAHLLGYQPCAEGKRAEHVAEPPDLAEPDAQLDDPRTKMDHPREEPDDDHLRDHDHRKEGKEPRQRCGHVRRIDHRPERDEKHHRE